MLSKESSGAWFAISIPACSWMLSLLLFCCKFINTVGPLNCSLDGIIKHFVGDNSLLFNLI